MSWDISLLCNCCGNELVDQNYTHNTNMAVNFVMLDNLRGLEQDMPRFREMNPDNGWGDIDQLVDIMRKMRDAVPEFPTTWRAHG